jgi:hypothetical protein
MQLSVAKVSAIVVLALVGVAGAYAWADVVMRQQIRDLRSAITSIGYVRGGLTPTDDEVRIQVETMAAEQHVEISRLDIRSQEASGVGAFPGGATEIAAAFGGRHRLYRVTATARVQKWMFSREEALDEQFALRTAVEFVPNATRDVPTRERGNPAGTRGLR